MKIKISNIKILANQNITPYEYLKNKYKINDIKDLKILRRSIDARDKENVYLVYTICFTTNNKKILKFKNASIYEEDKEFIYPNWNNNDRPVVVGFGPAGMFCALTLARCNAKPIIIERGSEVEKRSQDIENFYQNKKLNEDDNVLFGEGGAGTFSDGKLTTTLNDPIIKQILKDFVKFGASEEILYDAMPHIGSDILRKVVKNLREEIISFGGEVHFNTKLIDYKENDKEIEAITTNGSFKTSHLFLALGHSAYDTISMLYNKGVKMEAKSFSVGVRIEHEREYINKLQYASFAKYLPAAYYKMAVHLDKRSVYTFCMCPGGYVMATSNNKEAIVTNGMSNYKRDAINSNAALLVEVNPSDYLVSSPLDGFKFQHDIEHKAYLVGGNLRAPANLVKEFLADEVAECIRSVKPSYPHGINLCDLAKVLPDFVIKALKEGIMKMDEKMPGFNYKDAILIAPETRSSSPVRINRDAKHRVGMIYPIGEGAGYAGGITSAALDGIKSAILSMEEIWQI